MMIGAEDARSSVLWMLVQPMHPRLADDPVPISNQEVIEHQPRQGMESVPPRWSRGWHAHGEPLIAQDAPRLLVAPSAEVQIGTEHHSLIGDSRSQVPGLEFAAGRTEPPMTGRSPGIKVRAYQSECSASHFDGRRDGNSPLKYQWQLDPMSILQREGGENRVAPVTVQHAVPHGGGVAQVHAQHPRRLNDIFLKPELGDQHSARRSRGWGWQGRIAAICFLNQNDQRDTGIGTQASEFAVPDSRDELAQPASSDPDIPAQHQQTSVIGAGTRPTEVQSDWCAYVPAPPLQSETLIIVVVDEFKLGRSSQPPLPRDLEPVVDLANAAD